MKGGNSMDQKKIGRFLKELRKEKVITQEQLAEKIKVSGRTVFQKTPGTRAAIAAEILPYTRYQLKTNTLWKRKSVSPATTRAMK